MRPTEVPPAVPLESTGRRYPIGFGSFETKAIPQTGAHVPTSGERLAASPSRQPDSKASSCNPVTGRRESGSRTRPTTELPLREKVGNPQAIIGDESIQRSNRRMLHHCVDELSRVGHPHRLERQ